MFCFHCKKPIKAAELPRFPNEVVHIDTSVMYDHQAALDPIDSPALACFQELAQQIVDNLSNDCLASTWAEMHPQASKELFMGYKADLISTVIRVLQGHSKLLQQCSNHAD